MKKSNPFQDIFRQLKKDLPSSSAVETLQRQRLQALYLVSQQLITILDPDALFPEIIKKIVELLRVERAVIVMKEDDELRIRISHNIDDQSQQNALNFSKSVVSKVIDEYRPLYSANAIEDSHFSQFQTIQQLEILSFICVPIRVGQSVIGTIYVDNRHLTNVFSKSDVDFLQAIADLLGIAISNSLAYRQIEELNRSLEQKVEERTAELQATILQLKETQSRLVQTEKMAGLGRLIAGFIHEFNNPINFIYSNIQHLEDYSRKLLEATKTMLLHLSEAEQAEARSHWDLDYIQTDLQNLIEGFREGAERSRELVEDLRNFSGSSGGKKAVFKWNELVDFAVKLAKKRFKEPVNIRVKSEDSFLMEGIRIELNQALINLIQNGVDAGATDISISSTAADGGLRCTLRDNGCGIPQKDLRNIFDPFFSTKAIGKGIGLGLSLVYSTITHHGGSIEVSSKKNQGTEFRIYLPTVQAKVGE